MRQKHIYKHSKILSRFLEALNGEKLGSCVITCFSALLANNRKELVSIWFSDTE